MTTHFFDDAVTGKKCRMPSSVLYICFFASSRIIGKLRSLFAPPGKSLSSLPKIKAYFNYIISIDYTVKSYFS